MLRTALLFLALAAPAWAQPVITEDAKLVGSGTDSLATAGWAIAAADGFVVLGAFRDNSAPTTGAAYIFRETDGEWTEEVRLNASQQSYYTFGFAVAAWSGGGEDVVLVGAYGNPDLPESDAAYVFRRNGDGDGTWAEEARLADGSEAWEYFGISVDIYSNYAVVGALGADDFGEATGAAYIFRRTTDGLWVEEARLLASDASSPAGFGRGVAITQPDDGPPIALIGAPSDDSQRGAAYAFRRDPDGTWVEEAKLVAPDSDTGDLFGLGVAVAPTPDGEILALAGALGDRDAGLQSGAGYVYRREGDDTWVFEAKLTAADGQSGQRLGWSVALAEEPEVGGDAVAVLGADGAYSFTGTVRVYRRATSEGTPVWAEEAELWASDRAPGERLGYSVSASSRYAVAGAPYDDPQGGPAGVGAGYVWDLRRAVSSEPSAEVGARSGLWVYPNPFRDRLTAAFEVARTGPVVVEVVDVLGRVVRRRDLGVLPAGRREVALGGEGLPAGVYVVRLTAGEERAVRRVVRVR